MSKKPSAIKPQNELKVAEQPTDERSTSPSPKPRASGMDSSSATRKNFGKAQTTALIVSEDGSNEDHHGASHLRPSINQQRAVSSKSLARGITNSALIKSDDSVDAYSQNRPVEQAKNLAVATLLVSISVPAWDISKLARISVNKDNFQKVLSKAHKWAEDAKHWGNGVIVSDQINQHELVQVEKLAMKEMQPLYKHIEQLEMSLNQALRDNANLMAANGDASLNADCSILRQTKVEDERNEAEQNLRNETEELRNALMAAERKLKFLDGQLKAKSGQPDSRVSEKLCAAPAKGPKQRVSHGPGPMVTDDKAAMNIKHQQSGQLRQEVGSQTDVPETEERGAQTTQLEDYFGTECEGSQAVGSGGKKRESIMRQFTGGVASNNKRRPSTMSISNSFGNARRKSSVYIDNLQERMSSMLSSVFGMGGSGRRGSTESTCSRRGSERSGDNDSGEGSQQSRRMITASYDGGGSGSAGLDMVAEHEEEAQEEAETFSNETLTEQKRYSVKSGNSEGIPRLDVNRVSGKSDGFDNGLPVPSPKEATNAWDANPKAPTSSSKSPAPNPKDSKKVGKSGPLTKLANKFTGKSDKKK